MQRRALTPTCDEDVVDAIADAMRDGDRLAIHGGGSKADIGAPTEARRLDMTRLAGVVDYDPAELVLTVRAGTRLAEVEALVATRDQMLAFEPFDHGPLFGRPAGPATIGGVVAAGVAGSQRLSAGAPRDHLLGFRAVSGRGEVFVAGAKVVKNVTGYDLPKLAAGCWGRMFALTELTLKVLPRPRVRATWIIDGLSPGQAVAAMALAMGSQAEVAAAAHVPAALGGALSRTALRIQGFAPSVSARGAMLAAGLAAFGAARMLDADTGAAWWAEIATLGMLPADRPLWRINVPPSGGPAIAALAEARGAAWLFDWAGGLVWVAGDIEPMTMRGAAQQAGGHATLVRAPAAMRAAVPALHPLAPGVAALETRIRRAFDPNGVFETGRFHDAD
jgi:glycolate oxidase FAD binding subunit